ncbi:MAG TPA: ABC transporter permease [Gemmatimonadaceae bacterium]|nr:ABC transporter permease [Gemmatimonadaceae bacterium]
MRDWRRDTRAHLAAARLEPVREEEIVEELAQHLADRYETLRARGLSDEDATRAVLAELHDADGLAHALMSVEPVAHRATVVEGEGTRGAGHVLGDLWRDVRYSVRTLRRSPGFTATAVLCLALGIGATSTVFGIVDALFFRPPPDIGNPGEIVRPYVSVKSAHVLMTGSSHTSYPAYVDWRDQLRSMRGLAAYADVSLSVGLGAEARHADGLLVSGNYFPVLQVRPALGRFFTPEENAGRGSPPVAVVSYAYWRGQLGGSATVIGSRLTLDGHPFTIVGVAPRRFHGIEAGAPAIWIPVSQAARVGFPADKLQQRQTFWLGLVGRLAPGVTRRQAEAELAPLVTRTMHADWGADVSPHVQLGPILAARGPSPSTQATIARWLALAAAFVLAIACANTANLLLARAVVRRKEIGLRLSLGASRSRLVRQLLTECAVLALSGTVLGLVLAFWGTGLVPAVGLPSLSFFAHGRVLVFAIVTALACVAAFGLVPALVATRAELASTLKEGAREGADHRSRLRSGLMIVQVALATVLLVGAGLFVHSLRNVQTVQPGFDVDHLLLSTIDLRSAGFSDTAAAAFYDQALERVTRVPGVRGATFVSSPPLSGSLSIVSYSVPGGASNESNGALDLTKAMEGTRAISVSVGPRYFATVGTPILSGRDFSGQDRPGSAPVVIVNQAFAQQEWPGASALGRCIDIGWKTDLTCYRVVGVAANAKYVNLEEQQRSAFFLDLAQNPAASRSLLIRTAGDPADVTASVRRALTDLEPNLPYIHLETLTDVLRPELQPRRLGASMFGAFGLLALVLAAVGLYGVIAYSVERRTHELGVRMALGARPRDVLRLVVRQGMLLTLAGLVIGIAGALGAARLVAHLLFGVGAVDPLTFAGVAILFAAVAALASVIPAYRATRVDPTIALRTE